MMFKPTHPQRRPNSLEDVCQGALLPALLLSPSFGALIITNVDDDFDDDDIGKEGGRQR